MIGTMNEFAEAGGIEVKGKLRTYSMALDFRLEMRNSRRDDKSPSHDIIARGAHGQGFNAGVAWQGNVQSTGKRMYTLALIIPELFDGEKRVVAWEKEDQPGTFEIQWSKDKETTQQQATAA